jgi:cyclic pyranopterin phosphate synthase
MTHDQHDRELRDLRISITDRCNFRCRYCMPREHFGADHVYLPEAQLLSFHEIETVARAATSLGVRKIRLTGGEPLLRQGVVDLVEQLSAVDDVDLALTTNGTLLAALAHRLAGAGLRRVTISLDALDPALFARISDTRVGVDRVLAGIEAAVEAEFESVKLNMVVRRGLNDTEVLRVAERFRGTPVAVRFIEYMDVGATNGWERAEVVPSEEIVAVIHDVHPLEPVAPAVVSDVASRYRYRDGAGEIGVISSVTRPFCATCTRLRLSADGKLHTCLFSSAGHDLRSALRAGAGAEEIAQTLSGIWAVRDDRYSELRAAIPLEVRSTTRRPEMSYLGG